MIECADVLETETVSLNCFLFNGQTKRFGSGAGESRLSLHQLLPRTSRQWGM